MAQQTINNGESGFSVRNKLNNNFADVYGVVNLLSSTNTDIKLLTADWNLGYNYIQTTSADLVLTSDYRLSDERTPTAHKTTHSLGGTDYISPIDIGALDITTYQQASGNWESTYNLVLANSANNWNYQGTDIKALTGDWINGSLAYTVIQSNSASWLTDNSSDTEVRALTSVWENTFTSVQSNSAQWASNIDTETRALTSEWNSVYNTVQSNSATNWNNDAVTAYINNNFIPLTGGTLTGNLSVIGDVTYIDTTVSVTSSMYVDTFSSEPAVRITQKGFGEAIRVEDSTNPDSSPFVVDSEGYVGVGTFLPNEKLTVIGNVSATGLFYGDGSNLTGIIPGDTEATTLVRSNSADWQSGYTTVQSNSSINWNYQGTDLKALSSSWQTTYTTVQSNSSVNWDNALANQYADLNFLPLTGSALVGTLIGDISATGSFYGDGSKLTGIIAGDTEATTIVRSNSAKWESVYTTVSTQSASWVGGGSGSDTQVRSLTGNWQSTYTTVSSMSASWQTTFQAASAYVSSNPTGITGASALTKLLQITQAGYNSITPASDTLYIIVG